MIYGSIMSNLNFNTNTLFLVLYKCILSSMKNICYTLRVHYLIGGKKKNSFLNQNIFLFRWVIPYTVFLHFKNSLKKSNISSGNTCLIFSNLNVSTNTLHFVILVQYYIIKCINHKLFVIL